MRDTSQKGSFIRYALTDGRHSSQLFYFAQTRRGTRKVDSELPRARTGKDVRGGGTQCAGYVHHGSHGLPWKVDCTCAPPTMHACKLCRWFGGQNDSMRRDFGGGGRGMQAKHFARVLEPRASERAGSRKRRCMCEMSP
jgi:hypothetical protein